MSLLDTLRELPDRPLPQDRRRLAAGCIAFLVVAGAIFLAAYARQTASSAEPATTPQPASRDATAPASATSAPPVSSQVTASDARAAKAAARRFMRGYLRYIYGRGRAEDIDAASAGLIDDLAANPPRVPSAQRQLSPRSSIIQTQTLSSADATLLVVVDDQVSTYSLTLTLKVLDGEWMITGKAT